MNRLILSLVASLSLCAIASAGTLSPSDSGRFGIASPAYYQNQCDVLVDAVNAGSGNCLHRISVICLQNGLGSQGGAASYAPINAPITIDLYRPPSTVPVGFARIDALGAGAVIGLNGAVYPWHRGVSVTGGNSCGGGTLSKPRD